MPNIPLPDEIITIVSEYETLKVIDGKVKKARLEWRAPGLEIWVKGGLGGVLYESAANLALNAAIARHIPAIAVRKVSK